MKTSSIVIEPGLVDFVDLEKLAHHIATVKGSICTVQQKFVISSPDQAVLAAIGTLFQPVPESAAKREKKMQKRSKVVKEAWHEQGEPLVLKPAPPRGKHVKTIEIIGTTEKISRLELDKKLSDCAVDVGAQFRSPKHGMMRVSLREEKLVLVNDQDEVV